MRLLFLKEVPHIADEAVFRNSSWRALAAATLVMAGVTGYVAIPKGEPTNVLLIAVPLLATLLFLGLLTLRLATCLRRENWLLRIRPDGLYIHLRSYVNHHFPEETPTVLHLAYDDLIGVCLRREDRYLPGRHGGTSHDRFSYIDLVIDSHGGAADLEALARTLRHERRLPGPKHHDYPVRLVPPQAEGDPALLRLVWDQIRPGENTAVEALEKRVARFPDARSTAARWDALNDAGKAAYIAALWEMGYVEDAEQLVRMEHKVGRRGVEAYFRERFGDR